VQWASEWNRRGWNREDFGLPFPVGYKDGRPLDEHWESAATADLVWRVRMPLPDGGCRLLPMPKAGAGGRPRGRGKVDDLTKEAVLKAYAECIDVGWEKPTKEDVCERLTWLKQHSLERWLTQEGLLWPPSRWPE